MIKVMVLSTPNCTTCAVVKKMLERIGKEIPLQIEEYNVLEHPELLQKYPFLIAPGIVINGRMVFTGIPEEQELRKKLHETAKEG